MLGANRPLTAKRMQNWHALLFPEIDSATGKRGIGEWRGLEPMHIATHKDGKLYAINPNGTKKWDFETEGPIFSSPAIGDDGTIYFGSNDKKLYALDTSGNKIWELLSEGIISFSPAVSSDGTIFFSSHKSTPTYLHNYLYAINPNGTKKWKRFMSSGGVVKSSLCSL